MANVVGFAFDAIVNVAVFSEVFGDKSSGAIAKIGTGSLALPGTLPPAPPIPNDEQPAGPMPEVALYGVHGQNFALDTENGEEMENSDNKQVNFQGGFDSDTVNATPEYTDKKKQCGSLRLKAMRCASLGYHSATVVCQSETSWGPDFVSVVEGLYCDMCEKMLWSLCAGPGATYCFDLAARELRFSNGLEMRGLDEGSADEAELLALRKTYIKVEECEE